jgi:hypothetical protein
LDHAVAFAQKGIPINLIPAGAKGSKERDWEKYCTTDIEEIKRKAEQHPDWTNYGLVAKAEPNGYLFLDDDGGIRAEYEKKHGQMAPTLKNRSCSGAYHYIFKHSAASLAEHAKIQKAYIGETKPDGTGEMWSLRMHNSYVVAPGSVAPNKQGELTEYAVAFLAPIIEIPDALLKFLVGRYEASGGASTKTPSIHGDPIPYGEHDKGLTRIAGKLRHDGMEEDSLAAALIEICQKRCENYGDDYREMCQKIAKSVCRYEVGKDSRVLIGGRVIGQAADPIDVSKWQDNFKSVGELEAGDVRMLIRNFLPEGTCFLGGLPGEGKTLLALSITKALTTGENFLGRSDFDVPAIIPVIYLIPESGSRAFRKRCEKFHIPDDRARFICRTISEGSTLRLDDPSLIEAVRRMRPVIVLDTLIRFSDSSDENSATQNRTLADAVIRLRQEGAVAVIGLHHATKATRGAGMSLETVLRGSNDIAACADAVYGLLRDDRVYDHSNGPLELDVECVKPRDFDPPAPFRIAAERTIAPNLIGRRPGIASNIDDYGDFLIVGKAELKANREAELVAMIQEDPALTVKELSEATGLGTTFIGTTLKNLGWIKPRGGARRSHRWVRGSESDGAGNTEVVLD